MRMDSLSSSDKELVASLPYKVGVWMGQAADESGDRDDDLEMEALGRILEEFSKGVTIPPFVRQVCQEALDRKARWPEWAQSYMNVPDECSRAIAAIDAAEGLTERDLKLYRSALRKVAIAVAEAYGEFGMLDEDEDIETKKSGFLASITAKISSFSEDDDPSPDNISPAEQETLRQLVKALRGAK